MSSARGWTEWSSATGERRRWANFPPSSRLIPNRGSHRNDEAAVTLECLISGQEVQGLGHGLGKQQAVERIAVKRSHVIGPDRMAPGQRQRHGTGGNEFCF